MERDQVEEVKQKTDIVSIISEHITLTKAGRHFKALCPFHSEKTPSFIISPELQIYKCFGCGESGDVFTFLEKFEGMEFGEALKFLAGRAGIKLKRVYDAKTSEKEKLYEINLLSAKFYNYILLHTNAGKVGIKYLKEQRGVTDKSIKIFFLGYSPNNNSPLYNFLVNKKKFNRYDVEKAGLVVHYGGRWIDRFRGRIIFPIYDSRGNCVALAGRILPQFDTGKIGKYINSPETPVYHKRSTLYGLNITRGDVKRASRAIVVEGELDLISSWQKGIKNIVAIKGSSLTNEQAKILSRLCSEVTFALDSDWAGSEATIRGIGVISDMGIDMKVARIKGYKDPDEAVRSNPEAYKKSLEKAISVWDFIFLSVFASSDAKTGEGKTKISRKIIPILASIPDKIVRAHYIKKASDALEVPEEAVQEQLSNYIASNESNLGHADEKEEITPSFSRREMLEKELLRLIFVRQPYDALDEKYRVFLKMPATLRLCEELEAFSKSHKTFDLGKFSRDLPKELLQTLTDIVMKEDDKAEPERLMREIEQTKQELETFDIKERLNSLSKEISHLEVKDETEEIKKREKEFDLLTKKLSGLDFP